MPRTLVGMSLVLVLLGLGSGCVRVDAKAPRNIPWGSQPPPASIRKADPDSKSDLMRETLGDHIFEYLVREKRAEWDEFCTTVTDWEREHYYGGV